MRRLTAGLIALALIGGATWGLIWTADTTVSNQQAHIVPMPDANDQAFHDTKWIPNPGFASCHNLTYCTVQWTANATYDVAADYIWVSPAYAATQACTGWYNEAYLSAVGWACLWQLTYNAWPSFLAFYSQQNNGLVMVWADDPDMTYEGAW